MANFDISYIFKAVDKFSPAVKEMSKAVDKFQKDIERSTSKLQKLQSGLKTIGFNLTKYVTAPMAGAAVYAIKNAEQFEIMQNKLAATFGTVKDGATVMREVSKVSLMTGENMEQLTSAAQAWGAAGFKAGDALNKRLEQTSILAKGSGQDINLLAKQFSKWAQTGVAQTRMVAMLGAKGLPILKTMRELSGLSEAAFQAKIKHGILWSDISKTLDVMTKKGSAFYDVYLKNIGTIGASIERIHNGIRILSAGVGESIIKAFGLKEQFSGIADKINDWIPKVTSFLNSHPKFVRIATIVAAIAASLGVVALALSAILFIGTALFSPFAVISLIVTSLGAGMVYLYHKSKAFRDMISSAVSLFRELYHMTQTVGHALGNAAYKMSHGGGTQPGGMNLFLSQQSFKPQTFNVTGAVDIRQNGQKVGKAPLKQVDTGSNYALLAL